MNITHARTANRREQNRHDSTKNFGLKRICECGSGKKFKHCCYDTPSTGWGWVRLYQEGFGLVAFKVNGDTLPQATPEMAGASLVPIYSSFSVGMAAAHALPAAKPTYLVRMEVEELKQHIRLQFPAGSHVVLHIPAAVGGTADVELCQIKVAALADDFLSADEAEGVQLG
jgi:hypothetical protein